MGDKLQGKESKEKRLGFELLLDIVEEKKPDFSVNSFLLI